MRRLSFFLMPAAALTFAATLLSGCDVIAALELSEDRSSEYARQGDGDEGFFSHLPLLERQWLKRAESIAENPSFDPDKRPRIIPLNFRQQPWHNEIALLPDDIEARLSSDFGWRGLFGKRDFHSGIDIVADAKTDVFTPIGGEVIHLAYNGTHSGVVIADGERQYTFWHMTPAKSLSKGDKVEEGACVGQLVDLGRSTHLHYSIHLTGPTMDHKDRKDSNAVDPLSLLNL
ncbi:MAG: M23 family metallopeptidase [Alphaproteobacteria bacterium TMED89]|nr:MAG: M23 family metallopeptidase [Alphaproteobacteria bacterium TMED89]